jgi:hypothetical protein
MKPSPFLIDSGVLRRHQFVHSLIDSGAWSLDPEVIAVLIDSEVLSGVVFTLPKKIYIFLTLETSF